MTAAEKLAEIMAEILSKPMPKPKGQVIIFVSGKTYHQ